MAELSACFCFALRKVTRAVTQLYDRALRGTGLRITQLSILNAAARAECLTMCELAEVTATDRTTLTRSLQLLERKKLITICAGNDRRVRKISVTDVGRKKLLQTLPLWQTTQEMITRKIGKSHMTEIVQALEIAFRQF